MGELQTSFGRHEEGLGDLEELLRESEIPQHNALVVGAGLDELPYFYWIRNSPEIKQHPWLQERYSWEYLEFIAVLKRSGKPWALTVVDSSQEVCESIQRQEEVVIDDFYGQTEYAKRLLEAFGVNGHDNEELGVVNAALESARIANRATIVKRLYIPPTIRERITIVHGNVQNLDDLELPYEQYDVITVFNVIKKLSWDDEFKAKSALKRRRKEHGIIAADFEINGLQNSKPPRMYTFPDYSEEGELITHRYTIYLLGKPQAVPVEIPLKP